MAAILESQPGDFSLSLGGPDGGYNSTPQMGNNPKLSVSNNASQSSTDNLTVKQGLDEVHVVGGRLDPTLSGLSPEQQGYIQGLQFEFEKLGKVLEQAGKVLGQAGDALKVDLPNTSAGPSGIAALTKKVEEDTQKLVQADEEAAQKKAKENEMMKTFASSALTLEMGSEAIRPPHAALIDTPLAVLAQALGAAASVTLSSHQHRHMEDGTAVSASYPADGGQRGLGGLFA